MKAREREREEVSTGDIVQGIGCSHQPPRHPASHCERQVVRKLRKGGPEEDD